MFTKNGVDGLQNPLFKVCYNILNQGYKLLVQALRPRHPEASHDMLSCALTVGQRYLAQNNSHNEYLFELLWGHGKVAVHVPYHSG